MTYCCHIPPTPLGHFVDRSWSCAGASPSDRARILPRGTIELVINLGEDEICVFDPMLTAKPRRFSGAVVAGAYSRYFEPQTCETLVGVHFRPGGAAAFLGIPAGELADTHVDLEAIWGRAAEELREQLCAAQTAPARFGVLERALLERLFRSPDRHPAVPAALKALEFANEGVGIREIAREIGLCHRRLIQVFTSSVGMTPKRYQRVRRFQRAGELARHRASPDWADLALECGYFDQSHLIRDFRQFTGFSPGEFQRAPIDGFIPNHVAQIGQG
jgi:AraC-like DNA-binding protein